MSSISSKQKAFKYLKSQAFEAHHKGEAFKVLHICQIAQKELVNKDRKFTFPNNLSFKDCRWCISLYVYWTYSKYQLNPLPDRFLGEGTNKEIICYGEYIIFLSKLILLDEEITKRQDNIFKVKAENIHNLLVWVCDQKEDAFLLIYMLGLLFVKPSDKELWLRYYTSLVDFCVGKKLLKIKAELQLLYKRLCWQSKLFFREPLDNFKYIEDRIPPLVFWIKDYFDCFQDTESILKRIKEVNSKLSKENAEYIAFLEILRSIVFKVHDIERLINDKEKLASQPKLRENTIKNITKINEINDPINETDVLKNEIDELKEDLEKFNSEHDWNIEQTRYLLVLNSIPIQSFLDDLHKSILQKDSPYKAWILMIFALRNWFIYSFTNSCNFLGKKLDEVDRGLFYSLKSAHINDIGLKKTYKFDFLSEDKRKCFFRYLLKCPNLEKSYANEILELLSLTFRVSFLLVHGH